MSGPLEPMILSFLVCLAGVYLSLLGLFLFIGFDGSDSDLAFKQIARSQK